jgi:ATP-binding protein involved in chromosome partitioning
MLLIDLAVMAAERSLSNAGCGPYMSPHRRSQPVGDQLNLGPRPEFSSMAPADKPSAPVTEDDVMAALRRVNDPDRGGDIVSLGMVSGLAARDGHVAFTIEVDPQRGPKLEPLRKAAEQAVDAIPGVLSVTAVLTAHRPKAQPAPPQGHVHGGAPQRPAKLIVPGVRSIVAVASGKGGVGKSTVAINLALALAAQGLKVGMLDADIYGPSQPRMMGLKGRPHSPDNRIIIPLQNFGVKCMSAGFLVAEDTPMIWRGPMATGALKQMLLQTEWGELDILIVDMPPGTGDIQLTMAQDVPLTGAVIVSTPQDIALLDARKGLNMFRKVEVPVFGIIENMSYFICPKCGHVSHIFAHGGARAEAKKLGTDFLGEVPLHIDIRMTSDGGHPIVVSAPDSEQARIFKAIGAKVWEKTQASLAGNRRQAPRIVVT